MTALVMKPIPQTEAELLQRANQIAGCSFAELAEEAN
ncbi:DNA mismatch repair protein MutH, partial [Vibrio vulnificus]|nr:DNA mismatch repair protein MutH [Vibrio vulnificus]